MFATETNAVVQRSLLTVYSDSLDHAQVLSDSGKDNFRGSCEGSVSLAIKAQLATWIRQKNPRAKIEFEETIEPNEEKFGRRFLSR